MKLSSLLSLSPPLSPHLSSHHLTTTGHPTKKQQPHLKIKQKFAQCTAAKSKSWLMRSEGSSHAAT
ncbi:hypothetical protein IMZ48_31765 [Candidatus Bathyarchaeota archaeon]|nr:hypothetical protein [Candidatus Bathyarchaeota archaeon]